MNRPPQRMRIFTEQEPTPAGLLVPYLAQRVRADIERKALAGTPWRNPYQCAVRRLKRRARKLAEPLKVHMHCAAAPLREAADAWLANK